MIRAQMRVGSVLVVATVVVFLLVPPWAPASDGTLRDRPGSGMGLAITVMPASDHAVAQNGTAGPRWAPLRDGERTRAPVGVAAVLIAALLLAWGPARRARAAAGPRAIQGRRPVLCARAPPTA